MYAWKRPPGHRVSPRSAGAPREPDHGLFARRVTRLIAAAGPISVARFMGEANAHYYATRDPLGASGDFTTAPEISQMFGEVIGLWLADLWLRAEPDRPPAYVELGPGRGTLARDALRAMAKAGLTPEPHLVETSPTLRERQADAVADARFHDGLDTLPLDRPLLIIANEFFDALPVHQYIRTDRGWRERTVQLGTQGLHFGQGLLPVDTAIPRALREADVDAIVESAPAALAIGRDLARRIARQGGAALLIDYGYEGPATGDTLQALRRHAMTDPLADVGDSDLTAHVDFTPLAQAARDEGLMVDGPIGQGPFLERLGITERARALARATPDRVADIAAAHRRLCAPDAMGTLFRVMAIRHRDWPQPEGFA